jgi:tubulin---tyrosine ligase
VTVVLPDTQRSWIGKAHLLGKTVKPSYYRPPPASSPPAGLSVAHEVRIPDGQAHSGNDDDDGAHGSIHSRPTTDPSVEEWILVDGTPASCVQIGLYHYFNDKGPIDLVVSGPNYGRNTTAVFSLSSGTIGAALEAAVCRRRAVALSYAFFSRIHDPVIVATATRHSVRVIEALIRQWPADGSIDVYSINVPLVKDVEQHDVLWTNVLQNYWGEGSCFQEVEDDSGGEDEETEEEKIREEGETVDGKTSNTAVPEPAKLKHKHFKWAPRFADVYKSVDDAPPGNDGWAVKEGFTRFVPVSSCLMHTSPLANTTRHSVTPIKANFAVVGTFTHPGPKLVL